MSVTYRTNTTANTASGNISVNPPSGLASGDMWLIFVCWDSDSGTINLPSGWTQIGTTFRQGANFPTFRGMYKIAGSSESAVSITFTGGYNSAKLAHSVRVDGQHATTPLGDVSTASEASSDATLLLQQVTVAAAGALGMVFGGLNTATTVSSNPGSMTAITNTNTYPITLSTWYEARGSSGTWSPGTITWAAGEQGKAAQAFSVEPAAGGGGITVDASLTQAGQTVTAAATLDIIASSTLTQAGQTVASDASLTIIASSTLTQAGQTLTADAGLIVTADSSLVQDAQTLTADASLTVTVDASITQDAQTLVADASLTVTVDASLTQASQTLAATGSLDLVINAALTQDDHTLSATASTTGGLTADAAMTQDGQTLTADAGLIITADAVITQVSHLLTADAGLTVTADAIITQDGQTLTADAGLTIVASATITQASHLLTAGVGLTIIVDAALIQSNQILTATAGNITKGYFVDLVGADRSVIDLAVSPVYVYDLRGTL